jgi:hypothetical protein
MWQSVFFVTENKLGCLELTIFQYRLNIVSSREH